MALCNFLQVSLSHVDREEILQPADIRHLWSPIISKGPEDEEIVKDQELRDATLV